LPMHRAVTVWFERSVRAIVVTVLQAHGLGAEAEADSVVDFVRGQYRRMPDYLRLPLGLLTLMFDAYPCLLRGRPFHRLGRPERQRQVASWKHARLGVNRDLIRFYESLAIFGWQADQYADLRS